MRGRSAVKSGGLAKLWLSLQHGFWRQFLAIDPAVESALSDYKTEQLSLKVVLKEICCFSYLLVGTGGLSGPGEVKMASPRDTWLDISKGKTCGALNASGRPRVRPYLTRKEPSFRVKAQC